jgi:diaminopimelate decarboxylase
LRPPAFAYRRSAARQPLCLSCEKVDLQLLAERHGTPLYVYSAQTIRTRLKAYAQAFRSIPHTICYSVKANSTLAILRLVAEQGGGFDVVSGGEVERILRVQPKAASKLVFSGVGKTVPEMELAL